MSVAQIELLAPPLKASARRQFRPAVLLGMVVAFTLAALPSAFALLLFTRADLLLGD